MSGVNKDSADAAHEESPTRWQAALFRLKTAAFQLRRCWKNSTGQRPRRFSRGALDETCAVLAEVRSGLFSGTAPSEFALQAGKVQNLRVAARALHGLAIPAQGLWSFWAHVPRPTPRRGFAKGRELREGCVVPSIGGGLCQLSNALYDAARRANFAIVERHAHSRRLLGSAAIAGRDATVFWNYVDLRFRAPAPVQLEVILTAEELVVRFRGVGKTARDSAQPPHSPEPASMEEEIESCETCGVTTCFRHATAARLPTHARTAWLLDAFQPEFNLWMIEQRRPDDVPFVPLDSRRFGFGPYRWTTSRGVRQAPWTVLKRSMISRRLAAQGAERQRALLQMDAALAASYGRRLPALATHLVVSQNLLPFLWQRGDLGGRTFDVLMTRLPLWKLEERLDQACAAHPESRTLADFRAPRALLAAESAALAAARHWITPHSQIANLASSRAIHLPWPAAPRAPAPRGKWLVFPASTLGRKGAWEMRSLAREFRLPVRLCGPVLEAPDFWRGLETEPAHADWLTGALAVVLPAWVEHQPRRLLQAAAAQIPVIASEACGFTGVEGIITVPCGDLPSLRAALQAAVRSPESLTATKAQHFDGLSRT